MTRELVSLALNPRGTLFPNKSLIQITLDSGNDAAVRAYQQRLDAAEWSRRIYHPGKKDGTPDPAKKGMADRAVERFTSLPQPCRRRAGVRSTRRRPGRANRDKARLALPLSRAQGCPSASGIPRHNEKQHRRPA
jgi:hypothetical protein